MNYIDELHNLVNEIHDKVTAAEQAATDAARLPTTYVLPDGLGEVTVTGAGALLDVTLNTRAMTAQTPTSLARHLLHGIQAAERAAAAQRDATVAEAQKKARFT